MELKRIYSYVPSFSGSYGTGWKAMTDNFLRLLLVVFVLIIISSPMSGFKANYHFDPSDFRNMPFGMEELFKFGAFGLAAAFMGLIAMLYFFLLRPVFKYGAKMMFVQAARQITPDFNMLINGFLVIIIANVPQGLTISLTSMQVIAAKSANAENAPWRRLTGVSAAPRPTATP